MSSQPLFSCEIRSRTAWPVRIDANTEEELFERLRALFEHQPVLDTFAIAFDAPVPDTVRVRVVDTARDAIQAYADARWGSCEWTDDLVDESGWQGVRAQIDPSLAPCFAGSDEEDEHRHVGVWVDEHTFMCVAIASLDSVVHLLPQTSWGKTWVLLSHWHPNSMTSGSWSDELFHVDAGAGAAVLVGIRHMDEDGAYYSVSPCSPDPAINARTVVDFIEATWIGGVQDQFVPLIAHGFPADGSAPEFRVDLLPGGDNPGYELSTLLVEPPEEVAAVLHELGRLDAAGARRMRDAILSGVLQVYGPEASVVELHAGWHLVLERLAAVTR